MDAQGSFVGARGMCWLYGTSVGRLRNWAITSCWHRDLVLGEATAARSLLRCFGGELLILDGWTSFGGPQRVKFPSLRVCPSVPSVGSPVVNAYTKVMVGCRHNPPRGCCLSRDRFSHWVLRVEDVRREAQRWR
ncbi:hypothetical protein B296_00022233 [Ensete ventricosum]|uniref:Uncharacterized protein n=1 Tax=Ensete ventricosum TaxID=4639 RepID=A0A426XKH3_ENSVE|nr:hypothetical protein B296_00022233 [Ensete ventricosum]